MKQRQLKPFFPLGVQKVSAAWLLWYSFVPFWSILIHFLPIPFLCRSGHWVHGGLLYLMRQSPQPSWTGLMAVRCVPCLIWGRSIERSIEYEQVDIKVASSHGIMTGSWSSATLSARMNKARIRPVQVPYVAASCQRPSVLDTDLQSGWYLHILKPEMTRVYVARKLSKSDPESCLFSERSFFVKHLGHTSSLDFIRFA